MNETALILGIGTCANRLAETLTASGISVILTGFETPKPASLSLPSEPDSANHLEIVDGAQIRSLTGSAGRFAVEFADSNRCIRRQVQHVLLAEDAVLHGNGLLYGLTEGPGVLSLSAFKSMMRFDSEKTEILESTSRVAFLTGLFHESLPLVAREMIQAALDLQQNGKGQAYFFTGNLKVAGNGLETLSRKAKEAGVIFIKFTDNPPQIVQAEEGSIALTFQDEILRQPCVLHPDLTVFDETFLPSPKLKVLAETLGLETGPDGFLQADNIHRLLTFTNRKGIRVVGPARGVFPPVLIQSDIDHTALSLSLLKDSMPDSEGKAHIETGKCIRCLTCIRICPYRAVELAPRPVIAAEACEGCGICVAECPCQAIAFQAFPSTASSATSLSGSKVDDEKTTTGFNAHLTVFCCTRSAIPARDMAQAMEGGLPGNLTFIEVHCAGAVSQLHLLNALGNSTGGVMVLGCHPDNCHSGRGTLLARERTDALQSLLSRLGMAPERLAFQSLAANMGAAFSQVLENFMKKLTSLGKDRLKSDGGC